MAVAETMESRHAATLPREYSIRLADASAAPSARPRLGAPKTVASLAARMGPEFLVAEREGFLVASDLPADAFEALVDGVLAYARAALLRDYFTVAARTPPDDVPPVTMYVFRDAASYEANLLRHFRMTPVSPYGHYAHRQRYLAVNGDTGPGTLVHEMIHSLMAIDFPEAPVWASEGIASLYEQCRVEGGRLEGESNWRLPELRLALREGRLRPLAELFALDAKSFRIGSESLNYAHARYFCLYLEYCGLLRRVYADFRDHCAHDPSGRHFVEAACGQSLVEVDVDFRRWLDTREWEE